MANIQLSSLAIVIPVAKVSPISVSSLAVVVAVRLFKYIPPQPIANLACQGYCTPLYRKVL